MSVYSVTTTADVATGTAAKTIIQIKAGSTKRCKLVEWGISFEGTTSTDPPVDVRLLRQTTDGTAGSALTPVEWDEGGEAALFTSGMNFSAEPAAGDVLAVYQVTPNGGLLVIQYPFGREITLATSGRVGIECTTGVTVDARAYMVVEE